MRYSEIELQCTDIIWFGVDRSSNILMFATAGCGCVPEFVCRSQEETDALEVYFSNLPQNTNAYVEATTDEDAKDEALFWAQRGLYSFDVAFDDGYADSYVKVSHPETALKLQDLPHEIKSILNDHYVDIDALVEDRVKIKHAY